ncbi:Pre-rRNA-processing protein TSR2, putative [Theobroma cacao]|uniref:Pre-rRNA-processing protein TSR2, putative n=1 Tax=Theobroma cacao TaxID=3641 RepID=A0A061F2C1_THECC|nr:Pre-rRNA-processing protein TSR2, putative [Theobroma cacao]
METKKLTAESTLIFQEGIGLILSRWWALTAAVENEWGGRDSRGKANMLYSDVISFFTNTKRAEPLYIDDLENILREGLHSLNTDVDDGSIEEVAEKLMIMHEECLEGNYQSVEKLRTTNPPPVAHVRPSTEEDEDDDNDDDEDDSMDADNTTNMMVDVPNSHSSLNPVSMPTDEPGPNQAAEAADGWVVVSSRRNKGRRN